MYYLDIFHLLLIGARIHPVCETNLRLPRKPNAKKTISSPSCLPVQPLLLQIHTTHITGLEVRWQITMPIFYCISSQLSRRTGYIMSLKLLVIYQIIFLLYKHNILFALMCPFLILADLNNKLIDTRNIYRSIWGKTYS